MLQRSSIKNSLVAGLATSLVIGLAACSKAQPPPPPPTPVQIMSLQPRAATVSQEYVAELEAFNTVEIRPRIGGLLEKQVVVEGAKVKRGDVLFLLDQQPYIAGLAQAKAALAQAQAAVEQSQRDLARAEPLTAIDAISKQEFDAITARNAADIAAADAARAQVKSASLNLDYTTVTSPIDGVVGRTQIRTGGVVTAYTSLLTTVYDPDPMFINFSLSERRVLEIRQRNKANGTNSRLNPPPLHLLLSDGSEYPLAPTLNFIDAALDRTTGTLPVRLEVPNPDGVLLAGQFGRVKIDAQQLENALLIPQRAVQELQNKTGVWVVDADNKAQSVDVKLGARIGDDYLVTEGLKPGDRVVIDGIQKLKPGAAVTQQAEAPPAGAAEAKPGSAK